MRLLIFSFLIFSISSITVNSQSKLVFLYDSAGNQVERKYCADGSCTAAKYAVAKQVAILDESQVNVIEETNEFDESLAVFPNPTRGLLTMTWNEDYNNYINEILLIDVNSKIQKVSYQSVSNQVNIDLSSYPSGVYIVKFFLNDGATLTKKIIKI